MDLVNAVPYIQKFHKHPVSGEPLELKDLIRYGAGPGAGVWGQGGGVGMGGAGGAGAASPPPHTHTPAAATLIPPNRQT